MVKLLIAGQLTIGLIASMAQAQLFQPPRHYIHNPNEFYMTYRHSTTTRVVTPKPDPDSYFFGFFPIWSAILVCLTGVCLLLSLVGMMCWLAGCSNPRNRLKEESSKLKKQQQEIVMEEQLYDDISVKMLEANERAHDTSTLFSNSRLISEYDVEARIFTDAKKKKFMRDHL